MSAVPYLMLGALAALCVRLLVSRRAGRQDFTSEAYGIGREASALCERDPLTAELSASIFDPEDSDFVASEMPRKLAQQFRRERTALALDFLRLARSEVKQSIRAHRLSARMKVDVRPAEEIMLGLEFRLFQTVSCLLYLTICVCGPIRAASLARYSLGLAGQLRKVTEDVLPPGHEVVVELIGRKQELKS